MFTVKKVVEPLDALNGVRVMAMCNIILGHFLLYTMMLRPLKNFDGITRQFEDPGIAIIYAGFNAVDTFFWMTGVLTGYMLLKEVANRNGRLNYGLVYFHRFWRLLPTVAFTLFFIWAFMVYMGSGPIWYQSTFINEKCADYWWTNLTFLNNFIPATGDTNRCMAWTWYLSNDIQFFMFTPLVLYLYYKHPRKIGWAILGALCLCSVVSCMIITGVYDYNVVAVSPNNVGKFDNLYSKPYCRVAVFAIGLGCGWILYSYYRYKETKEVFDTFALAVAKVITKNTVARYVGFVVGVGLITFVVFIQHSAYADIKNGFESWTTGENVMFLGFEKILYGFGISAVLMPSLLGKFPYLTDFLGAAMWAPLAKMTFAVYLSHILVMGCVFYSFETAFFWAPLNTAIEYVAGVVLCYAAGFVLSLVVEAPFMGLEKALFAPRKRP